MVIQCDACEARFRLDRKLVEGYRAARVRCRRCGHPIVVSMPADAPASRNPPVPGLGAIPGGASAIPSATPFPPGDRMHLPAHPPRPVAVTVPLEEETTAAETLPDNLVDLLRFRESYRLRMMSGSQDISSNIKSDIPAAAALTAETGTEVHAVEETTQRFPADSSPARQSMILEESFLWRDPGPARRSSVFPAVKFTLLFAALGTAAAYLGLQLFLALVSWAIG